MFLICSAFVGLSALGYFDRSEGGPQADWRRLLMIDAVRWYSWMAVAPFVDRVARRGAPVAQSIAMHVVIAAVFIPFHQTLLAAAFYVQGWGWEPLGLRRLVPRVVPDAVLYTALAFGLTMPAFRRRHIESDARLRAALAEARLDALRQQLNPHFLFNTLNHIAMRLRLNEKPDGLRMLLVLSDLLHIVLADRAQVTPVRKEMQGVELYLEIERARFGETLQVEVSIEAQVLDALVPSFILQPLLENAMRHGVSPDGSCRVWLSVRADGSRLVIEVRDEGPGPSGATSGTGIGLANTRERLQYLYGDDHRFDLRPGAHGGTLVTVEIPLRKI